MVKLFLIPLVGIALSFPVQQSVAQENQAPFDEESQVQPILPPQEGESVVETGDTLDRLFAKLRKDPRHSSASATAKMIWREWMDSGSKTINLLMRWTASAIAKEDHAQALDLLDQVTVLAPEYAEGWNRRATLYFTMKDYGRSLSDIEATLALEPRHFGALSGLAVIMQQVGNDKAALKAWYQVLEIYPANQQAQKSVVELEEKLADNRA